MRATPPLLRSVCIVPTPRAWRALSHTNVDLLISHVSTPETHMRRPHRQAPGVELDPELDQEQPYRDERVAMRSYQDGIPSRGRSPGPRRRYQSEPVAASATGVGRDRQQQETREPRKHVKNRKAYGASVDAPDRFDYKFDRTIEAAGCRPTLPTLQKKAMYILMFLHPHRIVAANDSTRITRPKQARPDDRDTPITKAVRVPYIRPTPGTLAPTTTTEALSLAALDVRCTGPVHGGGLVNEMMKVSVHGVRVIQAVYAA
ncbi:hypothetical protein Cob_v004442 [Colletotrichum orbiculare MAFF 240422]|uniref:Uncharacterized protein n=1 Tax=Colletotrichum orbiculare (strain 104-T / ATCC 96160 / CBS 514.97 / LARS 414 / MAFF 240422) TaxID=1213857 RepID=A0A484FYK8_COLOR|nr:hypothetical protein Cob_v004442 [Colletotrichum orbiculare MAFF 240422]